MEKHKSIMDFPLSEPGGHIRKEQLPLGGPLLSEGRAGPKAIPLEGEEPLTAMRT